MRRRCAAWLVLLGCAPALGGPDMVHPDLWPAPARGVLIRPEVESFVDRLLAAMSVEEKVGQMIQADISSIHPDDLATYPLGSIQAGGNSAPGNDVRTTPQAWLNLTEAFYQASVRDRSPRHAPIPILFAIDAVHGHARIRGATIFPHNIGLGATHDPALIRRIGQVTADEVVTTGMDWSFAPTLAVVRDVRWGRSYESYSEDPRLVSEYATAMISGLQGEISTPDFLGPRHTIASAKHFLGDGGTADGRDQGDDSASEQELIRVHGAGFLAAVSAGAATIMASYNSWQGIKMHANHGLLTEVLKERMGFDGFVVGDWDGQEQIPGCSKFNCAEAILAGVDMLMGPDSWQQLYGNTVAQARSGIIPPERLNDAVRRILRIKVLAGLFDRPSPALRPDAGHFERLGSADHRAVARQAVRESLVLLKNEHAQLPLDPHGRFLVAGEAANDVATQAGGWTVDWQGDRNTAADFPGATSIYDGIKAAVQRAGGAVAFDPKGRYRQRPDAAIVVVGEKPYAEFEGDRENLGFAPKDGGALALLRRLHARRIPVVVILLSGRPLWVNRELNQADAFVAAWLPGSEGNGVADVLFRAPDGSVAYDFTGTLSVSWPRIAMPVRLGAADQPVNALFARGFGLNYGDHTTLSALPEEPQIPADFAGRGTLFFAGHVTAPWSIYLDDPVAAVRITTPHQSSPDGAVEVALGSAGLSATWHGAGTGTLRFTGPAIPMRRAATGRVLSMRYRVDRRPSAPVTLAIGCGRGCNASMDVTRRLVSAPRGRWRTMNVPLARLATRGGAPADIDSPFLMTTGGALGLTFSDIRIVR
ncbi:MAG: glycoside hydrolase family 3 N-terminal domain-containing protein [Steroidobacteraceae bacterium]